MHVASCSKLLTAMAMIRLLGDINMPVDTPIAQFLPRYWAQGPNMNAVTFRHLMTHTSGLGIANKSDSDYAFMRSCVATGSSGLGTYLYQNMNFGLCRILLATINGNIDPGANFFIPFLPNSNDLLWDIVTTQAYAQYMHDHIFGPSGVQEATLDRRDHHALAYSFPPQAAGWNSGDLTTMAGGCAWHLSVEDLLKVLGAFRRGRLGVSTAQAEAMLDAGLGIDAAIPTPLGNAYNKGGLWGNPGGQIEQSLAYVLPQDMELVLFANSPVGSPATSFPDLVMRVYLDNLRPRIFLEGITLSDATSFATQSSEE
jgi:CubicO group peptidase (beta-lactamase class C family)